MRSALRSRPLALALGLAAVLALAVVDFASGIELSMELLYLAPVLWAAWRVGRAGTLSTAALSAAAGFVADRFGGRQYALVWAPHWNAVAQLLVLGIAGLLLAALKRELDVQRHLAATDALTGIPNRREFLEAARAVLSRPALQGLASTVVFLDLDDFKVVNDQFGHAAGDALLCQVAATMRRSVRPGDLVARIGGDEFALLLPGADAALGRTVLDRLQANLGAALRARGWPVTATMGAVTFSGLPTGTLEELVSRADELMYLGKHDGKSAIRQEVLQQQPRSRFGAVAVEASR